MTVKAECTWGDGPDVLVVISAHNQSLMIVGEVDHFASFGMNKLEARRVANQLNMAADLVDEYEQKLDEWSRQHESEEVK